ncbi:MAG: NAD(P)/FAD-dependent oxidoreductase, partial [Flavobacteriales bacterium]
MTENPYFNYLPLVPTKGELMTIKAEGLEVDKILNKGFFCLPLGNNLFRVGATYNWKNLTYETSEEGEKDLITKIESLLTCDYKIIDHKAGIRPTVRDRRPLIGVHREYEKIGLFNGLGTKGVLIAPWLANHFADFLEGKSELSPEYDLQRVKKRK